MGQVHRYYYLSRPPFIGTEPGNFTRRECWYPKREIPGTERTAFGWVEYPEKLTAEQISHWSFFAADVMERAEMVFAAVPDFVRTSYLGQSVEMLQKYAAEHQDAKAWAALIILGVADE